MKSKVDKRNELEAASILYGMYQEQGDAKRVNRKSAEIQAIKAELKGNEATVKSLLKNENDYVKLIAASILFETNDEEAEVVLHALAQKRKLIGFEARMVLENNKR